MSHDEIIEIIEMAREAGCVEAAHPFNPWSVSQEALEILVRAARATGAAAEREACAKLFDDVVWSYDYREIAAAIRARRAK
jgi:hypothetical protein